jgi:hypothetical protein
MKTISNTTPMESGNTFLLNLRVYPRIMTMYAAGLGAVYRDNYSALRAVTTDAKYRDNGRTVPVIGVSHIYKPFDGQSEFADVLIWHTAGEEFDENRIVSIKQRGGRRITPVSDDLHLRLRVSLTPLIRDDEEYDDCFDKLEIMLGLIAADAAIQANQSRVYLPGGWPGRYVWRDRYGRNAFEDTLTELNSQQETWAPLQAGLFAGSTQRAANAFTAMSEIVARTHFL